MDVQNDNKNIVEDPLFIIELMKNISEGICLIRLEDNVIIYANTRFEKMFGYEPEEMIGKNIATVNVPTEKTPEETKQATLDILNKNGEWHGEVENIKKDGTHFWCYENVSMFEYAKYGKVTVSIYTDITKKKKIEEELKKSEEKWHSLFDILPVGVSVVDSKNSVIEFNQELAKILDISREGLLRGDYTSRKYFRSDNTIMPPEEFPSTRAVKEQINIQDVEIGVEKENGNIIWTSVSSAPLHTEGNSVTVTFNITEQKKMEKELKNRVQELEQMNKLMVDRELKMVELKKEMDKLKGS